METSQLLVMIMNTKLCLLCGDLFTQTDVYPGLGNHDYQNNVNDCHENNCASRMTQFMIEYYYQHPKLHKSGYPGHFSLKKYYKFPANRIDFRGSMSYSWDIGDIHFVQLHNTLITKQLGAVEPP